MNFDKHYDFGDVHALLSPSNHHWINYPPEKLAGALNSWEAARRGTRIHAVAKELIELGFKQPKTAKTFNMFVNDAIGFRMTPEQGLWYSEFCFGTTDAISFNRNVLRIHDLKMGTTKTSFVQLEIYAAIFCLEYGLNPRDFSDIELRIYQNDDIKTLHPEEIDEVMARIVVQDKIVRDLKGL